MISWPNTVPDGVSQGMVSIMDFLHACAQILGVQLPDGRPIDGIDHAHLMGDQPDSTGSTC
jgi:hypothetical protein